MYVCLYVGTARYRLHDIESLAQETISPIADFTATMRSLPLISVLVTGALAQSSAYGQCGGTGWTGATTCVSGYVCTYENDWYSQCIPGTASTTAATTTSSTATSTSTATKTTTTSAAATTTAASSSGQFKWFGVDESCAEFGSDVYPGTWGVNFIFPDNSSMQVSISKCWLAPRGPTEGDIPMGNKERLKKKEKKSRKSHLKGKKKTREPIRRTN